MRLIDIFKFEIFDSKRTKAGEEHLKYAIKHEAESVMVRTLFAGTSVEQFGEYRGIVRVYILASV